MSLEGKATVNIDQLYERQKAYPRRGWHQDELYSQTLSDGKKKPVYGFTKGFTPDVSNVIFAAGVHAGLEKEPVEALLTESVIQELDRLPESGIGAMVIPCANVRSLDSQTRYGYTEQSIGDADAFLPDASLIRPVLSQPLNDEAANFVRKLYEVSRRNPIAAFVDFHSDDDEGLAQEAKGYGPPVFSHGIYGAQDPIAIAVCEAISARGFSLMMNSNGFFPEYEIVNGICIKHMDGSIDDFMARKLVWIDGRLVVGPSAISSVVSEISKEGHTFEDVVAANKAAIRAAIDACCRMYQTPARGKYFFRQGA